MSGEFDDDIRASMVAAKKPKSKAKSTAPREPFEQPDTINTPLQEEQYQQLIEQLHQQNLAPPTLRGPKPGRLRMNDEYVGPRFETDPSEDYGRKDPGLEEMMNVLMSQSDNAPWYSHMQDL